MNRVSGIQLIIPAFFRNQLVVGSTFDDPSLFQYHDAVRIFYGRKAVRNDKSRPALHEPVHTLLHQRFRSGIDGGGRFVQNQDGRIGDRRPRNREQLALPLAEVGAIPGQHRLIAVRQPADKPVRVGKLRSRDAFVVRRLSITVPVNRWVSCKTMPRERRKSDFLILLMLMPS